MHEINYNDFIQRIISINSVDIEGQTVKAVITTNFLGRITTKPYQFPLDEWAEIVERKWIDER